MHARAMTAMLTVSGLLILTPSSTTAARTEKARPAGANLKCAGTEADVANEVGAGVGGASMK